MSLRDFEKVVAICLISTQLKDYISDSHRDRNDGSDYYLIFESIYSIIIFKSS